LEQTDVLPRMSRAQFEDNLAPYSARWWATGEGLIHCPEVMAIEGWNLYGGPGYARLTEAQRVLMMWSDLVGQTANGGFSQFADNYRHALVEAWRLIPQLPWPDLVERFEAAFRERAGDPAAPRLIEGPSLDDEPEKWARNRRRFVRYLLAQDRPWWRPPSVRDVDAVIGAQDDWFWQVKYRQAVERGDLKSDGEAVFGDWEEPPTEACEAFDSWFYKDETKAASVAMLAVFAHDRQAELCRFID
jgi:hypothetical protein